MRPGYCDSWLLQWSTVPRLTASPWLLIGVWLPNIVRCGSGSFIITTVFMTIIIDPRIGPNVRACVQYSYRKLTASPRSNACVSIVDGEFRPPEAEQLDSVQTLTRTGNWKKVPAQKITDRTVTSKLFEWFQWRLNELRAPFPVWSSTPP